MTFDLDFKEWTEICEKEAVERAFQIETKTRDLKGSGNGKNTKVIEGMCFGRGLRNEVG